MPGSIYQRNLRLARAYSEGFAGTPATNPHPAGSPAAAAYTAGALQNCSTYAGPAECTGNAVLGRSAAVEALQAPVPTTDWTKAQLKEWLDGQSLDYPSDATKAELQTLAGIN